MTQVTKATSVVYLNTKQPRVLDGLGVGYALQTIEEGKRPMSIDQLKGKYQLEFPFTVRRVREADQLRWSCGCTNPMAGLQRLVTITKVIQGYGYGTDVDRCRCGAKSLCLDGSVEKFILADEKY